MNIRRIATAALTATALLIGGAATAQAAPTKEAKSHSYKAPSSNGCGKLLAVTVYGDGMAIFEHETCEHDVIGKDTGATRTYEAPENHKGCGKLIRVRVTKHTALFRYAECDIRVQDVTSTE